MKKFLTYFFCLVGLTIALMLLFDRLYTSICENGNPRNKIQYLIKMKAQEYDVVFLGSSRVANHIDAQLFNTLSHRRTLNLGIEGAELNDNLLELSLLLKNNRTRFVFLEIDENLAFTAPSNVITAETMPYLQNEIISRHAQKYYPNYGLDWVPFYRYAINDAEIGFRTVFFVATNKKPDVNLDSGYIPKQGHKKSNAPRSKMGEGKAVGNNQALDEIKAICKANHIELILFIAPYCSKIDPDEYITKIRKTDPDLLDLSKGYADSLFFNCRHLNDQGSKILTRKLYEATKNKLAE